MQLVLLQICFFLSCVCLSSVPLPRGATGWGFYCDFGISWWYSVVF